MTLYNCKHDGDSFRITKFSTDLEVESSYLCSTVACECPGWPRNNRCRHTEMLPKFISRNHVGDGWFFDHDRGGWVAPFGYKPSEPHSPTGTTPWYDIGDVGSNPTGAAKPESIAGMIVSDSLPSGTGTAVRETANLEPRSGHSVTEPTFLEGMSQQVAATLVYTTDEPPLPITGVMLDVPAPQSAPATPTNFRRRV